MYKITAILFIVFVLWFLFFEVAQKGLQEYHIHQTERLTEILQNNTYHDCLFIGSSRTHDHINPQIIDSILHLNSYNAGIDAANMLEFKTLLAAYLQHHPAPKYLVLGIEPLCFNVQPRFSNTIQYYPFLNNKTIRQALQAQNSLTLLYYYLPFCQTIQYNDRTRAEIIKGWLHKTELTTNQWQYKGYLSNGYDSLQIGTLPPLCTEKIELNPSLGVLKNIIDTCKTRQIQLIFAYHPTYKAYFRQRIANHAQILQSIDSIAKQHQIRYLVHDTLKTFQQARLFLDYAHLNTNGATIYSTYLANELKSIFNKKKDSYTKGTAIF
jgi:hypothetical protein